jgi:hypothetical protein
VREVGGGVGVLSFADTSSEDIFNGTNSKAARSIPKRKSA